MTISQITAERALLQSIQVTGGAAGDPLLHQEVSTPPSRHPHPSSGRSSRGLPGALLPFGSGQRCRAADCSQRRRKQHHDDCSVWWQRQVGVHSLAPRHRRVHAYAGWGSRGLRFCRLEDTCEVQARDRNEFASGRERGDYISISIYLYTSMTLS